MMDQNEYILSRGERARLRHVLVQLPAIETTNESLAAHIFAYYKTVLTTEPALASLRDALSESLLLATTSRGYVLISGLEDVLENDLNDLRLPTAIASLVGRPFRAYNRWPLWKPLGVDLSKEPTRATGIGMNPFHVDLVNTQEPPEYVAFFCVRNDPAGGGASIISNLHAAIEKLPAYAIELLRLPIYREGKFYDLSGIGSELNPFPVLDFTAQGFPQIRFSGKSVLCERLVNEGAQALKLLGAALEANREVFVVRKGQFLILNQLIVAHGRLPLGPQETWPPDQRRLILQLFLRRTSD